MIDDLESLIWTLQFIIQTKVEILKRDDLEPEVRAHHHAIAESFQPIVERLRKTIENEQRKRWRVV